LIPLILDRCVHSLQSPSSDFQKLQA